MPDIIVDAGLILEEIKRHNVDKFTGKLTITINMSQGGIGHVSVNSEKTLKKPTKS